MSLSIFSMQYGVLVELEGGGISSTTVTFEACFFASSLVTNNAEVKGSVETPETLATLLKGSLSLTEKQPWRLNAQLTCWIGSLSPGLLWGGIRRETVQSQMGFLQGRLILRGDR